MTFNELATMEPRLRELEAAIMVRTKSEQGDKLTCANAHWYGCEGASGYKVWLEQLVGWHRKIGSEVLRSSEAYMVATNHLYSLMPDCKGCGCPR